MIILCAVHDPQVYLEVPVLSECVVERWRFQPEVRWRSHY